MIFVVVSVCVIYEYLMRLNALMRVCMYNVYVWMFVYHMRPWSQHLTKPPHQQCNTFNCKCRYVCYTIHFCSFNAKWWWFYTKKNLQRCHRKKLYIEDDWPYVIILHFFLCSTKFLDYNFTIKKTFNISIIWRRRKKWNMQIITKKCYIYDNE